YLGSLLSLSIIVFVPAMIGLSLALVFTQGVQMLLVFPLLAAFLLVVTALTYQFQGWLASLMANPRRRRTVIVVATMLLMVVVNLPNLINILRPWGDVERPRSAANEELAELDRARAQGRLDEHTYEEKRDAIQKKMKEEEEESDRQLLES